MVLCLLQEEGETTILQLEKDLRTQVELMRKQKKERRQELKLLQEQDQELCEILCMPHYDIDSNSVPSLEELNQFRQHVATKIWHKRGSPKEVEKKERYQGHFCKR